MKPDCGKVYGPRCLTCVKPAGHSGRHTHIRSAQGIGVLLRRKSGGGR